MGDALGDVLCSFWAPQFKNKVDHLDSKKIDQTSESYDFWRRREHTGVIKLTEKENLEETWKQSSNMYYLLPKMNNLLSCPCWTGQEIVALNFRKEDSG